MNTIESIINDNLNLVDEVLEIPIGMSAICPQTGISFKVKLVAEKLGYMEYPSQYNSLNAVSDLVHQQYKDVQHQSKNTLAGCLLTVLIKRQKIQDKLSSYQRNLILQDCPKFLLVTASRVLLAASERQCNHIASISLQSFVDNPMENSTIEMAIKAFVEEWNAIIFPVHNILGLATTASEADNLNDYNRKQNLEKMGKFETARKPSIPKYFKEHKARGKELIGFLQEDATVKERLIQVLKTVFTNDNLITVDSTFRAKLSGILIKLEIPEAKELAEIVDHKSYATQRATDFESMLDRAISDDPVFVPKRLTLAEIIEKAKIAIENKKQAELESKVESEELESESEELESESELEIEKEEEGEESNG